jgi:hypothetical protein
VANYVHVSGLDIADPAAAQIWRRTDGAVIGTVELHPDRGMYLAFDDPALARAVADACIACADAMEAFPPAEMEEPGA